MTEGRRRRVRVGPPSGIFRFVHGMIKFGVGDALGSIHTAALHDRGGTADVVSKGVGRAEHPCRNRRLAESRVSIGESLDGHRHTAPIRALGGPHQAGGEQFDRRRRLAFARCNESEAGEREHGSFDRSGRLEARQRFAMV